MWCSEGPRAPRLLGAILVIVWILLSTFTSASADSVPTAATVRNGEPELQAVDVLLDARLGVFVYVVEATDRNGGPDLERAIFHFLDAEGRVYVHRDTDPEREGTTATWTGVANLGIDVTEGPFRVHLHVYDRHDAEATTEVSITLLEGMLDASDEEAGPLPSQPVPAPRPFTLLGRADGPVAPSESGWILLGGLVLAGTVAAAWSITRPRP